LRRALTAYLVAAPVVRGLAISLLHLRSVYPLYVLLPTHGDGLAIGVLLAMLVRNESALTFYLRNRRAIGLVAFGLALNTAVILVRAVGPEPFPPITAHTYTPIALVCGCLLLESVAVPGGWCARVLSIRPLRFFGAISYCLYLFHPIGLRVSEALILARLPSLHVTLAGYLFVKLLHLGIAMALVIPLCVLSGRFFERPFLRLARASSVTENPAAGRNTAAGGQADRRCRNEGISGTSGHRLPAKPR